MWTHFQTAQKSCYVENVLFNKQKKAPARQPPRHRRPCVYPPTPHFFNKIKLKGGFAKNGKVWILSYILISEAGKYVEVWGSEDFPHRLGST